jgi:AraC-like DNA-binding protein
MINYSSQEPAKELADYVRFFWTLDARVDSREPFVHRALPDNCLELIFYCKGQLSISSSHGSEGHTFTSGVFGHTHKFRQFKTRSDFTLFGVYFYPHSLKTLFNLPASALTNAMVDSETLWGNEGKLLEEKVILAPDTLTRIKLVTNFLLKRIKTVERREQSFITLMKNVVDNNSLMSIPAFANDFNLSRRQLERRFKELSGFSPKDFFRVVRFKNVLKASELPNKTLAQIAIDSGYYDQSHFTHEFKKFSGYSPKEFFVNVTEDTADLRTTRDFKI